MKISFAVGTIFCYDCVLALRKFIGSMKGVESVEVEEGKISIEFDSSVAREDEITQIAKDSVAKLGYKILN